MMELTLTANPLYKESQTLRFEKIATLIGENGSGKSCILQSIFDAKLDKKNFDDLRVVCFSSGQNENFSERFSQYLAKERKAGRTLTLECFYYDKSWSNILIFLATCLHSNGKVREFLRSYGYVDEEKVTDTNNDDVSSSLTINFKVDKRYAERVQEALKAEESGEKETLRSTPYFRSLASFIDKNIDNNYDFLAPLNKRSVTLTSKSLLAASYEAVKPSFDEEEEAPALHR